MSMFEIAARRSLVGVLLFAAACSRGEPAQAQESSATMQKNVQEQLGSAPAPTALDTATAKALSETFRNAAARALPSVVFIKVTEKQRAADQQQQIPFPFPFGHPQIQPQQRPPEQASGSGFIFDSRGYILTNNHVVRGARLIEVQTLDGRDYDAKVVGRDPNSDIAVIKITPPKGDTLPAVQLGNSDSLHIGDWVLALGNPLGNLNFSVTAGIVSAKGRSIGLIGSNQNGGNTGVESYIQTDAAINPGNSGGPLINLLGQVVGINGALESETGYNVGYGFAVPINLAKKVASDLMKYGVVHRPQLGVLVGQVNDAVAEELKLPAVRGALITQVQPNTPAQKAGLKMEDVIVDLNGKPVKTQSDLVAKLAELHPGDRVNLTIIRNGKRMTVPVTLGKFPEQTPAKQPEKATRSASDLLGFSTTTLTPDIASQLNISSRYSHGAVITSVNPYGPARENGLARGMLIIRFDGKAIKSSSDLQAAATGLKPGEPVRLVIVRPGKDQTPQVVIYRTAQ